MKITYKMVKPMNVGSRTDESYAAYEEVIELVKYKRQIRSTEDTEADVPQMSQ